MHKLLFKFFGISVLSFSANIVYAGFFDGLIKDISSLPNAVVEGVIGGLTSNKSNNPSSSTNSQISSNTVNTNLLKLRYSPMSRPNSHKIKIELGW